MDMSTVIAVLEEVKLAKHRYGAIPFGKERDGG
jgi:hypothetical protein